MESNGRNLTTRKFVAFLWHCAVEFLTVHTEFCKLTKTTMAVYRPFELRKLIHAGGACFLGRAARSHVCLLVGLMAFVLTPASRQAGAGSAGGSGQAGVRPWTASAPVEGSGWDAQGEEPQLPAGAARASGAGERAEPGRCCMPGAPGGRRGCRRSPGRGWRGAGASGHEAEATADSDRRSTPAAATGRSSASTVL